MESLAFDVNEVDVHCHCSVPDLIGNPCPVMGQFLNLITRVSNRVGKGYTTLISITGLKYILQIGYQETAMTRTLKDGQTWCLRRPAKALRGFVIHRRLSLDWPLLCPPYLLPPCPPQRILD